jgi:hypothetical protein
MSGFWTAHLDPHSGRPFWYNARLGELGTSTWTQPDPRSIVGPVLPPALAVAALSAATLPAPPAAAPAAPRVATATGPRHMS